MEKIYINLEYGEIHFTFDTPDEYYELDRLITLLEEKRKEGYNFYWISMDYDRHDDVEGFTINFAKRRLETDDEFNARMVEEKMKYEKEKIQEEARLLKEKEKRYQQYLNLKNEFEPKG